MEPNNSEKWLKYHIKTFNAFSPEATSEKISLRIKKNNDPEEMPIMIADHSVIYLPMNDGTPYVVFNGASIHNRNKGINGNSLINKNVNSDQIEILRELDKKLFNVVLKVIKENSGKDKLFQFTVEGKEGEEREGEEREEREGEEREEEEKLPDIFTISNRDIDINDSEDIAKINGFEKKLDNFSDPLTTQDLFDEYNENDFVDKNSDNKYNDKHVKTSKAKTNTKKYVSDLMVQMDNEIRGFFTKRSEHNELYKLLINEIEFIKFLNTPLPMGDSKTQETENKIINEQLKKLIGKKRYYLFQVAGELLGTQPFGGFIFKTLDNIYKNPEDFSEHIKNTFENVGRQRLYGVEMDKSNLGEIMTFIPEYEEGKESKPPEGFHLPSIGGEKNIELLKERYNNHLEEKQRNRYRLHRNNKNRSPPAYYPVPRYEGNSSNKNKNNHFEENQNNHFEENEKIILGDSNITDGKIGENKDAVEEIFKQFQGDNEKPVYLLRSNFKITKSRNAGPIFNKQIYKIGGEESEIDGMMIIFNQATMKNVNKEELDKLLLTNLYALYKNGIRIKKVSSPGEMSMGENMNWVKGVKGVKERKKRFESPPPPQPPVGVPIKKELKDLLANNNIKRSQNNQPKNNQSQKNSSSILKTLQARIAELGVKGVKGVKGGRRIKKRSRKGNNLNKLVKRPSKRGKANKRSRRGANSNSNRRRRSKKGRHK